MQDLRQLIAANICALRTARNMTQLELADSLNYSDKAISKWERAEALPDVTVLKQIADMFGVSVDYLLAVHSDTPVTKKGKNKLIISLLSVMLVWLVATFIFVELLITGSVLPAAYVFIYAVPASAVVGLVFNSIWGKRKLNYLIISVMVWTLILSVYLTLLSLVTSNLWHLFLLGIPAQIIIILWSYLSTPKK